jgi:hypothetical protein
MSLLIPYTFISDKSVTDSDTNNAPCNYITSLITKVNEKTFTLHSGLTISS